MSVRLFLSIIGYIVALAIMPIGSGAIAQEGGANSQKEKLAELQAELRARQQVLENNRASAQELENVLKASELEIAKVAKALSSTRQSLKNIEQEQAKLEEEQEGLRTAIRKQQSLLSSQLKSAFMAGHYDYA
ncbi:peptidase M23, partial [Alteromonas sp. BZK5]|nr:peptidase M23 [Alteromonas sp. BZK5]